MHVAEFEPMAMEWTLCDQSISPLQQATSFKVGIIHIYSQYTIKLQTVTRLVQRSDKVEMVFFKPMILPKNKQMNSVFLPNYYDRIAKSPFKINWPLECTLVAIFTPLT